MEEMNSRLSGNGVETDPAPRSGGLAALGDSLSRRLWLLDAGRMCEAARRRTRLRDFGNPPLEPALSILCNSLESEANLHPLGRFLMRMHLQDLLETRLRLAERWRRGQAKGTKPITRPIFITGTPRSGSTFLHELLTEDPANRAPRVWEVMFPVPPSGRNRRREDPRVRRAAACLWWFRRFAPQADAVFPMRAWTPHECVAIHSYSFMSEEFVSTSRIPQYESYLRQADLRPAYAWQRRFLEHLESASESDGPRRQWVLKSPDHVYGLEALFSIFPDALIIQTHRNPFDVLKSSCHLTQVLHGLYSRPGDPAALAARESKVLAQALDRFVNFRDAHPELAGRFVDVKYDDIVADPLTAVRRVYENFDLTLSAEAIERMKNLSRTRSRYDHRRPASGTRELTREKAIVSCFERYCSRFKLGWQQPQPQ
jgi:hypothetical protein